MAKKIFTNKKFLLYLVAIVIYSLVIVMLRHSFHIIPNWVFWVLSFLLIFVLNWIRGLGDNEKTEQPNNLVKEEGRYYFYNNLCSFNLPKEEIMQDDVAKNGLKHTLTTKSMAMTIIEIRDGMPNFPDFVQTKNITIAGYPCLAAKTSPIFDDYNQYFFYCKKFVVQVSMTIVSEDFLNSFRIEK